MTIGDNKTLLISVSYRCGVDKEISLPDGIGIWEIASGGGDQ